MKRLVTLICCFTALSLYAKQSTFIYFEDKNGFKDSIEIAIGLTDEQIADIPELGIGEAYIALREGPHWVWIDGPHDYMMSRVYAYKPYDGFIEKGRQNLWIRADRLPITISWDKQFFVNNNLMGSVLSDWNIWFESGCEDEDVPIVKLAFEKSYIVHYTYVENASYNCTYQNWLKTVLVKRIGLSVGTIYNYGESVEIVPNGLSATKILRNGQLLIENGDKTYNAQGAEIR